MSTLPQAKGKIANKSDYDFKTPNETGGGGSTPFDPLAPNSSGQSTSSDGKASRTPTIVGSVIGVVGGLAVLGLLFWLWWRRRQRLAERDAGLRLDPYTPGSNTGVEKLPKGVSAVPDEDANLDAPPQTAPDLNHPTRRPSDVEAADYVPPRRFLQEEDAEDVLELLPPRYRQRNYAELEQSFPSTPGDSPGHPVSGSSSSRQAELDPLTDEHTELVHRRPPLKEAYARAFDSPPRTTPGGPRPLGDVKRSQGTGSQQTGSTPLRTEYKRIFGSDSTGAHSDRAGLTDSESGYLSDKKRVQ